MKAEVLARLGGGGVCGMGCAHVDLVEELSLQDRLVGGFPGVCVVEDACYLAFGVVQWYACPLAVGVHLGALDLEVLGVVGEGSGVISIPQAACVELVQQVGL